MQANGSTFNAPGLQQSSVAQAKAQEKVALAQAQQIRVSIKKATIISPINGVVVNRNLNPGEYPDRDKSSPCSKSRRFTRSCVARPTRSRAFSRKPRRRLRPTDAIAGTPKRGGRWRSQRDSARIDAVPGKSAVAESGRLLRPGMAVSGGVALPEARGVLVPTTAFTDDNHDAIQIVQTDNTAKTISVTEVQHAKCKAALHAASTGI